MPPTVELPESVAEAVGALWDGGLVIAGGTEVMPRMNTQAHDVETLVSLRHAGLVGIAISDGIVEVGAATTLAQVGEDERLAFLHPVVESIASPSIRNLATVGGNLFVEQPYGDFAVCLLALDADLQVAGPQGSRSVSVAHFFEGGIEPQELVAERALPAAESGRVVLHEGHAAPAQLGFHRHGRGRGFAERWHRRIGPAGPGWSGAHPRQSGRRRGCPRGPGVRPRERRGRGGSGGRRRASLSAMPTRARGTESASSPFTFAERCWAIELMPSRVIELVVNGEPAEFLAPPGTTLLTTLRETLGLTAAKRGCAQGTCGTCTVLLDGRPVMACLIPVETINGASVQTLEGVSGADAELDEVQAAFLEGFATQCGFCTSGMIMAAEGLLATNPDPSREDVVRAISGNVCRCTGYELIINAILDAAARRRGAAVESPS